MEKHATIQDLHTSVWAMRHEIGATFSTPNAIDSLRFASCEAHEALDAWLRQKGGFARNNNKELDIMGELGQCAMMLLTALGPDYKVAKRLWYDGPTTLEEICSEVAALLLQVSEYSATNWWKMDTIDCLDLISRYPGMDLALWVGAALDKARSRWGNSPTQVATREEPVEEQAGDEGVKASGKRKAKPVAN